MIWVLKNEENGNLDLTRASERRQVRTSISGISSIKEDSGI